MNKPIVKIKLLPGGKMPEKKTAGDISPLSELTKIPCPV